MYVRNLKNYFKMFNFVFSEKHVNIYSLSLFAYFLVGVPLDGS